VETGTLDVGLTGKGLDLGECVDCGCADLIYSKTSAAPARWVLVGAEDDHPHVKISRARRSSRSWFSFTRRFFAERNYKVDVILVGATGGKVIEGLADAIVEVTETGSTLRANKLVLSRSSADEHPADRKQRAFQDPGNARKIDSGRPPFQAPFSRRDGGLKMNVRATISRA